MMRIDAGWPGWVLAVLLLCCSADCNGLGQNGKKLTPEQVKALDAYFENAQREEAAARERNRLPMELGVWEYIRTDANGHKEPVEQDEHCQPGYLQFAFQPYIPPGRKMDTNHGLGFRSEKVGDGLYKVQSSIWVEKLGETLAVHMVRMQGSKAFDDQIKLKSRLGIRHASMAGRWLRGCKP